MTETGYKIRMLGCELLCGMIMKVVPKERDGDILHNHISQYYSTVVETNRAKYEIKKQQQFSNEKL